MKRHKSSRNSFPDRHFPELTPERRKELKALAPELTKRQLQQLDWEINEIAELLLAIYRARRKEADG